MREIPEKCPQCGYKEGLDGKQCYVCGLHWSQWIALAQEPAHAKA